MPRSKKSKKQQKEGNLKKSGTSDEVKEQTASDGELVNNGNVMHGSTNEVEKIVRSRVYRGRKQYLVRWKGCKEFEDTWENESSLQGCSDLIKLFNDETSPLSKTSKEDKQINSAQEKAENKENSILSDDETNESETEIKIGKKRTKGGKKEIASAKKIKTPESKDSLDKTSTTTGGKASDEKAYEVEKIIEMHTRRDGTHEFLIRWKGYKSSDDTWEPEAHLDCQDLINKFMDKVKKAKNIPPRELREADRPKRVISTLRGNNVKGRHQLRNPGFRPYYME